MGFPIVLSFKNPDMETRGVLRILESSQCKLGLVTVSNSPRSTGIYITEAMQKRNFGKGLLLLLWSHSSKFPGFLI